MKPYYEILLIACGGALGAMSRYGINELARKVVKDSSPYAGLPIGTFIANIAGCFLVGVLIGSGRSESSQQMRMFVGVGFLGALTTFSTFGAETIEHFENGSWAIAGVNVIANVVSGLAAVVFGMWLGRKIT